MFDKSLKSILCILFLTLFLAAVYAPAVMAQKCNTTHQMIASLRKPEIGSYNLWDHVEGTLDKKERYISAFVVRGSGHVVVLGERYISLNQDKEMFLQQIDRRGRNVWIKDLDVKHVRGAVKLLRWSDGFTLVANVREKGVDHIWIGIFDMEGNMQHRHVLKEKKFHMRASDATVAHGADRLLLSVQAEPKDYTSEAFSMLYWLNRKGRPVRDRAFMLGLENEINEIVPHGRDKYFLVGAIDTEDGRKAGWLMHLDEEGEIRWQRPYPRGRSARFNGAALFNDDQYLAVVGHAYPNSGRGRVSGWIMMADVNGGDIAWQRFYREDASIFGRDVFTQDDGQIFMLMDLQDPDGEDAQDYVRLLVLNPRGVILSSRTYNNGEGANVVGLLSGKTFEPIMYGSTNMMYSEEKEQADGAVLVDEVRTQDAWMLAGAAADRYNDPCLRPYSFLP